MADHHTSSHMPASMIDGCSLSRTKWKVHAFELDKGLVCLPDKCVSLMCSSLLTCRESFPLPLQGFFCCKCTLTEKKSHMCLAERISLMSRHMAPGAKCSYACTHKWFHIVFTVQYYQEDHLSLLLLHCDWLFIDSTSRHWCSSLFGVDHILVFASIWIRSNCAWVPFGSLGAFKWIHARQVFIGFLHNACKPQDL